MSDDLPTYWGRMHRSALGWTHPDDERVLGSEPHTFNLQYPPPAFVGNVTSAKVIILVANGGYDPRVTPREFEAPSSETLYLQRLTQPTTAKWSEVAPYYGRVNYAAMLFSGLAAAVNLCAYRSPKISQEPANRRVIRNLPSARYNQDWLANTVFPQAEAGERLIVGKRCGLWDLPTSIKHSRGYIADPAPVSPHLSKVVLARIQQVFGNV